MLAIQFNPVTCCLVLSYFFNFDFLVHPCAQDQRPLCRAVRTGFLNKFHFESHTRLELCFQLVALL